MDFDTLYLLALRYLNIRFRSEKEIRDYLKKRLSRHSGKQSASRINEGPWTPFDFTQGKSQDDGSDDAEQMIDLIVRKLKQQKFLNDEEFATMWIRSRTEFKPKGQRLIRLELQQKGVSKEIVDKAFEAFGAMQKEENGEERDELSLAKEILEKKRKKFEPMDKQERFNKAGSLLARRGFGLDIIKAAIDEVFGK